jgi:hypothetical protein
MATIVLVHGIGQEASNAEKLEKGWLPSLVKGVRNAKHDSLADELDKGVKGKFTVKMAYYGDIFLEPDHQGVDLASLSDAEQLVAEELALDLLNNATHSSNTRDADEAKRELAALTAPPEDQEGIVEEIFVRAAAALDHVPFFGRTALAAATVVNRTLAQVTRYLIDPDVHKYAINQVSNHLTEDTRVVIGHSLGSVVAYDTLRARPVKQQVPLLVTLGSPLGLSAIRERLQPQPPGFPTAVRRWVNIAAPDDIVAARYELNRLFNRGRPDDAVFEDTQLVDNGSKPHEINFYLDKDCCGQAVANALK